MIYHRIFKLLLWSGALFYFSEFLFHFFGLPILEHDTIFILTHDLYIAIFALTYAALLVLIATNVQKYKLLFYVVMAGIAISFLNGLYISLEGGYGPLFNTVTLDGDLRLLGAGVIVWYATTWLVFWKTIHSSTAP